MDKYGALQVFLSSNPLQSPKLKDSAHVYREVAAGDQPSGTAKRRYRVFSRLEFNDSWCSRVHQKGDPYRVDSIQVKKVGWVSTLSS